jgi:regulator of sigma D
MLWGKGCFKNKNSVSKMNEKYYRENHHEAYDKVMKTLTRLGNEELTEENWKELKELAQFAINFQCLCGCEEDILCELGEAFAKLSDKLTMRS